jgi:hypothetical protein
VRRVIASFAIFAGWLSIPGGAMAGLIESKFFGLGQADGPVPDLAVYGISAAVILWLMVLAAFMMAVPMAMAMFAANPQRRLYLAAVGMAVAGLALVPDDLGRVFGLPLVAGAAAVFLGARLMEPSSPAATPSPAGASSEAPAGAPIAAAIAVPMPATATSVPTSAAPPASATGRERKAAGKAAVAQETPCPWCSASIAVGATVCPGCHASFGGAAVDSLAIPGLTEVEPALRAYSVGTRNPKKRPSILRMMFNDDSVPQSGSAVAPSETAALQPPSAAIKAEMARLDLEIALSQLHATGDEPHEPKEPAAP